MTTGPAGWPRCVECLTMCRAGHAHLGWELFWDQAGVSDGPDEQPTSARCAPADAVASAIATFFGLTAGEDEP